MAPPVADRIRDDQLRRAVAVDRHGAGLANATERVMAELEPDLLGSVGSLLERMKRRGPTSSVLGSRAFGQAQDAINRLVTKAVDAMADGLESSMRGLAKVETEAAAKQLGKAVGRNLKVPDLRTVGTDAIGWPIGDRTAREWLSAAGDVLAVRLKSELQGALARGTADSGILADIRRAVADAGAKVAGVARTAARNVANRARQRLVDANLDDFRGIMWLATLEPNNCKRCLALHGRVFKPDVGPRPQLHPSCQCQAVPLVKGEPDPAVMDADDWLASQDREFQDEVLGPSRAQLWRMGSIGSLRDLTNRRTRALTLDELRARAGAD